MAEPSSVSTLADTSVSPLARRLVTQTDPMVTTGAGWDGGSLGVECYRGEQGYLKEAERRRRGIGTGIDEAVAALGTAVGSAVFAVATEEAGVASAEVVMGREIVAGCLVLTGVGITATLGKLQNKPMRFLLFFFTISRSSGVPRTY